MQCKTHKEWYSCARMEKVKEDTFRSKKQNISQLKQEEKNKLSEKVKAGRTQITDNCKYPGMTISTDGQLTEHIKELNARCDIINREICICICITLTNIDNNLRLHQVTNIQ